MLAKEEPPQAHGFLDAHRRNCQNKANAEAGSSTPCPLCGANQSACPVEDLRAESLSCCNDCRATSFPQPDLMPRRPVTEKLIWVAEEIDINTVVVSRLWRSHARLRLSGWKIGCV